MMKYNYQHAKQLTFIGDVHARIDKLEALVTPKSDEHLYVFMGDLIDNKPEQTACDHLATLNKVKAMVDAGEAVCIMANHELNAIGWSLPKGNGEYWRPRDNPSNKKQHQLFIQQLGQDSAEYQKYIQWFKTLPLFIEFEHARAIHACWHQASINKLKPYLNSDNSLKSEHWQHAFDDNHELYHLLETLLKGPEQTLPNGKTFEDKNGTPRTNVRIAWWKPAQQINNFYDLSAGPFPVAENLKSVAVEGYNFDYNAFADAIDNKLTVIGHYTLQPTNQPAMLSDYVVCVDYNGARDDNPLVAFEVDMRSSDKGIHTNFISSTMATV
ncbi:metallophosphoesterase [Paraferrimonas sp. SM1919]|uniref:metallophosphoesterase n=1 Tax=Paraferrimonas sp. SM1919 TaxID=2662263 RepID=UPI0013D25D71|nr:metallophosphoesterase [Paraferrimonas sp. SM1919]